MGQFLCPSSGVFHCTHSNGICHTGLLTACEQDQDGTGLLTANQFRPDDGQRNCLKHVEFYCKNKFEKLVHLVGFILRNEPAFLRNFLTPCLGYKYFTAEREATSSLRNNNNNNNNNNYYYYYY